MSNVIDCIKVAVIPMAVAQEKNKEYQAEKAKQAAAEREKHLKTVQEYVNRLTDKINAELDSGYVSTACFRKKATEPFMYRNERALEDAIECIKTAYEREGYVVHVWPHGQYYHKILDLTVRFPG